MIVIKITNKENTKETEYFLNPDNIETIYKKQSKTGYLVNIRFVTGNVEHIKLLGQAKRNTLYEYLKDILADTQHHVEV